MFFPEGFRNLSSQNIWDHLETFFNLEKADLIENSFLDTEEADVEFSLPEKDFAEAITVMNKGKLKTPEMNLCSHNSGSSS
jgi:hypothetical protein